MVSVRRGRPGFSIRWSSNSKSSKRAQPKTSSKPRWRPPRRPRSKPSRARSHRRSPFPEHLPRERVVIPGPTSCDCCGSTKLAKLGEDITETLEVIPRQWKVIQYVREKFTCRHCESISQPPAPFHVIPRGFAEPEPARHDPVREIRRAPTAQSPERAFMPRRASISACRRWLTWSVRARWCSGHWSI